MLNSSKSIEAFPEDEYVCTLPDKQQNIAFEELREEPHLRQQAIESMRHFIEKQQHIIKCRMDSNYLLRFLRAKKFSIPTAQESLDKFLSMRQRLPEIMQNLDPESPILTEMTDMGILVPLTKKDNLGRTVVIMQIGAIDPKKISSDDCLRLWIMILEILLEDEYTQINGIVIVSHAENATLAHAGMWTLPNLKKLVLCWEKAVPLRNKGHYCCNAPTFIVALAEITKSLVSRKLSERIHIVSNVEQIYDIFPTDLLPKELGGEKPLKEYIDEWKCVLKNKRQMLLLLDEAFEINENLRPKDNRDPYKLDLDDGIVGSFRKLEID